jgi:hypothetical protein
MLHRARSSLRDTILAPNGYLCVSLGLETLIDLSVYSTI